MIHADPYTLYSYQDYLALREDIGRFEIIEGLLLGMASPSPLHQIISKRLLVKFEQYLENKSCQIFDAPLDVRLFPDDNDKTTIVQPDIFVICDKSKIPLEGAIQGAPDLIIEIVSPSTRSSDFLEKRRKYRQAGVKEYWIVVPFKKIHKYLLSSDRSSYSETIFEVIDGSITIPVSLFNDELLITLSENEIFR